MTTSTTMTPKKNYEKTISLIKKNVSSDVTAFCPGCKTMETLSLNGEGLAPTSRFTQRASEVYHACGSEIPCRLYSLSYYADRN